MTFVYSSVNPLLVRFTSSTGNPILKEVLPGMGLFHPTLPPPQQVDKPVSSLPIAPLMLWMLCRCTLVLFIIGSLYRSISGSSGGGRFFKIRLHIRTNPAVSIWGSKLGVHLFYKNVLFNNSLRDLIYYYTILCYWCTVVNPDIIMNTQNVKI